MICTDQLFKSLTFSQKHLSKTIQSSTFIYSNKAVWPLLYVGFILTLVDEKIVTMENALTIDICVKPVIYVTLH